MKTGHILAFIGAALVLAGGALLDWQVFHLADVVAKGTEVAGTGQGVLGLAAAIAVFSLLGLFTWKKKPFATVSLFLASCLFGWLIAAHVTRSSAFLLMEYEVVDMLGGYTLAVWGSFLCFFGPLVVLAAEPNWDPSAEFLRVALLWGDTVIQERVLQEPQTFRIGEDLRNDFILPNANVAKKFPLFVANRHHHWSMGLAAELRGDVHIRGESGSIAEWVKKGTENKSGVNLVDVGPGDWGTILVDEFTIFFQFIQPDSRVSKKGFFVFDEIASACMSTSFWVQAGFLLWTIFAWNPTAIRVVKENQRKIPTAVATIIDPQEEEDPLDDGEEDDTTAKAAEGEEGKFGDPEEDPDKESKVPKNDGKMVDKIDPKKVGLNDLLSTNKLGGEGAIANILNSNTDGFSNKIAVAMAGTGSEFVMGHGSGGLGFKGTGTGGGGEGGYGRIHGMGKIDTGGGMGVRAGLGKKRSKRVGKMKVGRGATQGFCKKGNIASVVKRRAGAIRACYESRLQLNPKLGGKITARWTIDMEGKVKSASTTKNTVKDGKVGSCVLRVLRRMRFAKPEGGICVVQWPFVFNSGA